MDPHRSFSNSIVKRYCGEDTKGGALWENNTMSKFSLFYIFKRLLFISMVDKNIARTLGFKKELIFGVFLDDTCCNNSMHLKKGKIIWQ